MKKQSTDFSRLTHISPSEVNVSMRRFDLRVPSKTGMLTYTHLPNVKRDDVLPEYTEQGAMPPGIHHATLDEIEVRWGTFQRSDRRPQFLKMLREFAQDVRRCRWILRLLLAGSFVTEKAEPNDIDILLVFEQGADFVELRPHEYNVLYQAGVQRRFGPLIDLHVVEDSSEALERWLRFFQRDRNGASVGLVEVVL